MGSGPSRLLGCRPRYTRARGGTEAQRASCGPRVCRTGPGIAMIGPPFATGPVREGRGVNHIDLADLVGTPCGSGRDCRSVRLRRLLGAPEGRRRDGPGHGCQRMTPRRPPVSGTLERPSSGAPRSRPAGASVRPLQILLVRDPRARRRLSGRRGGAWSPDPAPLGCGMRVRALSRRRVPRTGACWQRRWSRPAVAPLPIDSRPRRGGRATQHVRADRCSSPGAS